MCTTSLKTHEPPLSTMPSTLHDRASVLPTTVFPNQVLLHSIQSSSFLGCHLGLFPVSSRFAATFMLAKSSLFVILPDFLLFYKKPLFAALLYNHRLSLFFRQCLSFFRTTTSAYDFVFERYRFYSVDLVKVHAIHRYFNIGLITVAQRQTPVHLENSFNLRY